MNRVLIISNTMHPLMPCHPARARELLAKGKAAIYRPYPFTIVLKERETGDVQPVQLKIDPGAKTTGLVLVMDAACDKRVIWGAELKHRGFAIGECLRARASLRRSRRTRKLRHRALRWLNRRRAGGWIPPSLETRVANVATWVSRLGRLVPVAALSVESVRFDMQKVENPEIEGVEYQRGTLFGCELKEYVLLKWGHRCAYCDRKDVPLQVEHIVSRSRGGTDRVSNLTLSCERCNQRKGTRRVEDFLASDPKRLAAVLAHAKAPLKDAAAVNTTRRFLVDRLRATGLPLELGSGGRTRLNRTEQRYPKRHWIDAACVGCSGEAVKLDAGARVLSIRATGRGSRQMCGTDKHGLPIRHRTRAKTFEGFQTGDIVRADLTAGKYAGRHLGRISIRQRPSFRLDCAAGRIDVHPRCLKVMHRADGYTYE